MSGCFGNHPVDRWMENQLMQHLAEEQRAYCQGCDIEGDCDDDALFRYDEETEKLFCRKCGKEIT